MVVRFRGDDILGLFKPAPRLTLSGLPEPGGGSGSRSPLELSTLQICAVKPKSIWKNLHGKPCLKDQKSTTLMDFKPNVHVWQL